MNINFHNHDSGEAISDNSGSAVQCNNHLDDALKQWGIQPQNVYVEITKNIHETLIAHKERTGFTPEEFFEGRLDIPDGLTVHVLKGWIWGSTATARMDHLKYVLDTWETLSKQREHNLIWITKPIHDELQKLKDQTGVSAACLLQNDEDIPDGLTHRLVEGWLSGTVTQAHRDHIKYVLKRWKNVPDDSRIEITKVLRDELHAHKERTGVGVRKLFRYMDDVPEGLYHQLITAWLSGNIRSAQKEHFTCVLNTWKSITLNNVTWKRATSYKRINRPDDILATLPPKDHIEVTREIRRALHMHINRSGVWPHTLLKNEDCVPEGLDSLTIHGWLSQKENIARTDHLKYVLQKWQELPDMGNRN